MRTSVHAMYRWIEYFGSHDIGQQFARARRVGKKTKRQIAEQCPVRFKHRFEDSGVYYLRSPAGAIFVVAPGEFIVDVFPLGPKSDRLVEEESTINGLHSAADKEPTT